MRRLKALTFLICLASIPLAFLQEADAASVNAVLSACDRTEGCGYSINDKNGDISGCSKSGCFYCANDGKRECVGVSQASRAGVKGRPAAVNIGGVKLSPQPRSAGKAAISDITVNKKLDKSSPKLMQDKGASAVRRTPPGSILSGGSNVASPGVGAGGSKTIKQDALKQDATAPAIRGPSGSR
jgi:hypothetical protein